MTVRISEAADADSELSEYLDVSQRRRRLFPRAALVGLLAGLTAVAFRLVLAAGDQLRNSLISWSQAWPMVGWFAPILFGALGSGLAVLLMQQIAPETSGSGIPHTEAVLHRFRDLRWRRVLPIKFLGGTLALTAGLALGREGPTVQMGGAVGAAVAERLRSPIRERLTLIAAGAGAGLAAAFNAPLAGLVFVLEELQRDFRPGVFGAAFVAAAVADIVSRLISGQQPVFTIPSYPSPPLTALPAFALLGVLAGLLGVLFNRALLATMALSARLSRRQVVPAAVVSGACIGLLGWFAPQLIGGGHHLTDLALLGDLALLSLPLLFVVRLVLTLISYGTRAPGGIFAPLLVLGALLGLAVGRVAQLLVPSAVPEPAAFAVVGMAAYFTAIVRAPLTGVVLIVEMTGNYNQMLPLLVASFSAYVAAEALGDLPIYEALLQRDLRHSGAAQSLERPSVHEYVLQPGAPFDGRRIRDLGLPPGCIIVRCTDGAREWIPTAETRLHAHLRITAAVAPEAEDALQLLHDGCTAG